MNINRKMNPCFPCGKAKSGECRAENKSACKAYMDYFRAGEETYKKRALEVDVASYHIAQVDGAYKSVRHPRKRVSQ